MGQQVLHGKHRLVFDLRFRAHLEEHDVLSTINTTRIRSPVLNGRLLDRDGEFVGGRGVDVRHVLEFTARNREHVLFRRSFENAHLNAKRHLHDRLGQIDRLDNARILESSGISESAHCQNEQEKYCEISHDSLTERRWFSRNLRRLIFAKIGAVSAASHAFRHFSNA